MILFSLNNVLMTHPERKAYLMIIQFPAVLWNIITLIIPDTNLRFSYQVINYEQYWEVLHVLRASEPL